MLGFVHRDIKPGNIMYSKEFGRFVYIDFGISEWRREKPG
jgi:serine/threonine protein kinase